ncbi:flagellar filament capping protein FliD [Candidatus Bathyarchaeota archaeon]|nr:flagellar filament capping protein FliD [Candidatus Bathyarchaeota archaeon]
MPNNGVFIPGMSDKLNSQETINKIMETKRVKLTEMEDQTNAIKDKKKVLNEIKEKTVTLLNSAKKLYGFEAPFNDKVSQSTDENAFSAAVTRNVDVGEYSIEIINKAEPHKITSKQLDKKYKIPAGNYSFKLGNEDIRVSFKGGTLEEFAKEIKKDSNDRLNAYITWNTKDTQILVLEGKKTGANNFISFGDEATKELFKTMDFFQEVPEYDKTFKIEEKELVPISRIKSQPTFVNNDTLVLEGTESYKYNLPEKIPYRDTLTMEIDLRLEDIPLDKREKIIPTGPNFSKKGDITLFDIHVEGESPIVRIPPYQEPKEPVIKEDDRYIEIITNKRKIELDDLEVDSSKKTLRFNLNNIIEKDESVEAVILKNNNTFKKLEASNLRFYDESSMAKMKFKNELSKPRNAKLIIDGIEIERESNIIDDLIKGLTLNVYDKTNKPEKLKIDRDYEKIVGSVTDFLGSFNQFLDLVNKETSSRPDSEGKIGTFVGDYSLISLTTKLRNLMMNSYQTSYGEKLSLLAQIGVSTNASGVYRMDTTKLRGILEVNEDKFLEMMEKYPEGVKELFGSDTNKDLIIDNGIAFLVQELLKVYTSKQTGYFDNKEVGFDREIERKGKEIENYKEKLEKEEQQLRKDFIKMEKAMEELEENKNKFDNFNNNK